MDDEKRREIRARIDYKLRDAARKEADRAAARDKSDPFIWARVYTHVMNGIGVEHESSR